MDHEYLANLVTFCKLRSEGAFEGHEHEWVLIEKQKVVSYFANEDDILDYEDTGCGGAFQPVDDRRLEIEKKRVIAFADGS